MKHYRWMNEENTFKAIKCNKGLEYSMYTLEHNVFQPIKLTLILQRVPTI